MPNESYLIAAYAVTWVTLAAYTLYLVSVRKRARAQYEASLRTLVREQHGGSR